MKRLIFVAGLFLALAACKNKNANVDMVKFPPPVVKADVEVTNAKVLPPPGNDALEEADAPVGSEDKVNGDNANAANNNAQVSDTSKKIIKEGTIEFETANLAATRKKILGSLKKYGGYVDEDDQTTNGDSNRKEYELKIRIPANNFDLLLDTVSSTADKIDSRTITITDVTTQYIDIKTRLDNKKILEKRYLELLSKSSKISDLLEIENKLTEIRSAIESTQGQLNYLSRQVAYSSLDITFYTQQTAQVNSGNGPAYKFKTAIADGWQILQNLFFGIITLWPVILLLVIIYWLIKRWRKRRKVKKAV